MHDGLSIGRVVSVEFVENDHLADTYTSSSSSIIYCIWWFSLSSPSASTDRDGTTGTVEPELDRFIFLSMLAAVRLVLPGRSSSATKSSSNGLCSRSLSSSSNESTGDDVVETGSLK